jgi:penicillin-binding protein 1A
MKRRRREKQNRPVKRISPAISLKNKPWITWPLAAVAILAITAVISIYFLSRDLPLLTELEQAGDTRRVSRIYSDDGVLIRELSQQYRIVTPFDKMPDNLIQALVSSEDHRFYNHWGLDLVRIVRVAHQNITQMRIVAGASTITQQLAKTIYLTPKQTFTRKLREQLTALQIERTYSKNEIIEMYLNRMEVGRGAHGVQAGAIRWFGKDVSDLKVQESAMIVGLFQLPYGHFSPDRDTSAAKRRRNIVMHTMVASGFITPAEYDSLRQMPLGVIPRQETHFETAPYFAEHVTRELQRKYGIRLWTDGFTIETTLDTRVQACADSAVRAFIPGQERDIRNNLARRIRSGQLAYWFDNNKFKTQQDINRFLADSAAVCSLMNERATLQTALVAINPSNGYVLAMTGGRDFNQSNFNRATQMVRQPGSAFKPIVYTAAIDNGYPPTETALNAPVVVPMPNGDRWAPTNFDNTTGGETTMREALRRSLNLVTVRLTRKFNLHHQMVNYAKAFGLTTDINPFESTALGSEVVRPIELVSAFSVFPNQGSRMKPITVKRVLDNQGNVLEQNFPEGEVVFSAQTAFIMTDMLQDVIERGTASLTRTAYRFYRPAGGKTGTTNDYRDAWFVGFTPQIAAGVWVGFDDERVSMGERRTGAMVALPVWAPFMRMAHDTLQLPLMDFTEPRGIAHLSICAETYKIATPSCPSVYTEIFRENSLPSDSCEVHQRPFQASPSRPRRVF